MPSAEVSTQDEAARELERLQAVAERTSDFVGIALADGQVSWINPAGLEMLGLDPGTDVRAMAMTEVVARHRVRQLLEEVVPAAVDRGTWSGEMDFVDRHGTVMPVWQLFMSHRDHRGEVGFYSTVARRLRASRLPEVAAHTPAAAASARLRSLVDGLSAVVWEADASTVEFSFVSERAEQLLGYPAARWIGDAGFWPSIIHPEDREAAVSYCAAQTAAGRDHDFSYRAHAADGRIVWLHDVVHVVCDEHGVPVRIQGVMIDVTAQKRAERTATLLVDAGDVLATPGEPAEQLAAFARLTAGPMGEVTVVSVLGDDGDYEPVATAHSDPGLESMLVRGARARTPQALRAAVARGTAFVVTPGTAGNRPDNAPDDGVREVCRRLGLRTALMVPLMSVVPLTARGQPLGLLIFGSTDPDRTYDDTEIELGRQLGGRVATALEAHQLRERNRRLYEITTALAAAPDTRQASAVVTRGAQEGLRATFVSLYRLVGSQLQVVHRHGYADDVDLGDHAAVSLDEGVPLTDAVRTGRQLWIDSAAEVARRYPAHAGLAATMGIRALAVLPLRVAGVITGALSLSFDSDRVLRDEDHEFAGLLADQAAQTLERTLVADERRQIAETLQRSLLPPDPPAIDHLAIACRYLPGALHTHAGGDWYDVLDLGDGRVAIAVGDVVGQGTAAAAVMGQLRSALAAHLLDGDPPAQALRKLDRFSRRVPGSRASTAACLVLDTRDGSVRWARAGHLPPLVVESHVARYLDDAHGCVLGIPGVPPCEEGTARIGSGSTVLLYTDGLVERRDETIDDGLARLAAIADRHADAPLEQMAAAVLDAALGDHGPPDDIALIAVRLGPA